MRYFLLIVIVGFLNTACALETPYVDQEIGNATRDAFERQIVHKDYRYANQPVEGLQGIHSESIMQTYHNTFTDSFTQESIDITATGE